MTMPSTEERELYYYGLPSLPKLVARSSTHIWQNPQMPGSTTFTGTANMYPKSFRPAGIDPLLNQLWNDAISSLRIQILEAVSAAKDWTAIDILRVGLNEEFHTTLLLSVKPDSLSWDRGHAIALRCKAILEEHNIHHVHCEIRESIVTLCADASSTTDSTATTSMPGDFQLSSTPIAGPREDIYADLSDCLGTTIAMDHADSKAGTKGLYLALSSSSPTGDAPQDEPTIVALTCRHVVLDLKTESLQTYHRQPSQPFKEVIQVDQSTYEDRLQFLKRYAVEFRENADSLRDHGRAGLIAQYDQLADDCLALEQIMRPYEASSSRVFGRLLYSPELKCTSSEPSWLRDWALIELLPSRHQAQLSSLKNKVFVGSVESFTSLLYKNINAWKGLPWPRIPLVDHYTIELQKVVVPIEELRNPTHTAEYDDEKAIFVAKYGARGGLTIGLGNSLVSIIRCPETSNGEQRVESEEWPITSIVRGTTNRQEAFSVEGDSGSCIWDLQGRPAGMLMAGGGLDGLNDVTYAQPLERLLDDIRNHGFNVSLI